MRKQHVPKVLSSLLMLTAWLAPVTVYASSSAKISCQGRVMPEARKKANESLDADILLDKAMKGKKFDLNAGASLVSLETNLVQYHGLASSVRSIPDDEGRRAMGRVASLIENNYAIAAKMALGASIMRGLVPQPILKPLSSYVTTMTEPHGEAPDLMEIDRKITQAQQIIGNMSEKPRAFARWVVLGYAWDDRVAIDASLAGYCTSSPTAADHKLLETAVGVARLDRSQTFEDLTMHEHDAPVSKPKK